MTDTDQNNLDQLIAIRTGLQSASAQLLKGVLESHGIPAFLANENMGTLNFAVTTDLLVRAGDKARAETLLSNVSTINRKSVEHSPDPFEENPSCPHCRSDHIHKYIGAVPTVIPGLRLNAGPADGWSHCMNCDSYWHDQPRRFRSMPIALGWALTMSIVTLGVIFLINWLKWL